MPLRMDERILVRVSQSRIIKKVTDFIEGNLLVLLRTDVLFHLRSGTGLRLLMTRRAPASPKVCAMARPMPRVPPVISASLPSRRNFSRVIVSLVEWLEDRLLDNALRRRDGVHRALACNAIRYRRYWEGSRGHRNVTIRRPRQHEEHRIGDLLGLHQAARGERLVHLRLRPVIEQRRYDRARGHRADPDAVPLIRIRVSALAPISLFECLVIECLRFKVICSAGISPVRVFQMASH
jgi:hypothetical protein